MSLEHVEVSISTAIGFPQLLPASPGPRISLSTSKKLDCPTRRQNCVLQKSLELLWCLQQESDWAWTLGHFVDLNLLLF